jgi:hypothetical protein
LSSKTVQKLHQTPLCSKVEILTLPSCINF